mgnify:CR=1 FL=1
MGLQKHKREARYAYSIRYSYSLSVQQWALLLLALALHVNNTSSTCTESRQPRSSMSANAADERAARVVVQTEALGGAEEAELEPLGPGLHGAAVPGPEGGAAGERGEAGAARDQMSAVRRAPFLRSALAEDTVEAIAHIVGGRRAFRATSHSTHGEVA